MNTTNINAAKITILLLNFKCLMFESLSLILISYL